MIINPFHVVEEKETSESKLKPKPNQPLEEISYHALQTYVITHYMEYLQKGLQDELAEKLEKYILEHTQIKEHQQIQEIIKTVLYKMFGYDILQPYIEDTSVSDIRVVAFDHIYIKKRGCWERIAEQFQDENTLEEYIRYCVLKNNATINFDVPIVTVSDKAYHLRIEAGIPPVNVGSPSLVIRIHHAAQRISLESLLVVENMLDKESYVWIQEMIQKQQNVMIAGKGGSGKTTLLRAMIEALPDESAITINEETAELFVTGKNIIQREIIDNREESKKIDLEKLMKQSLVMSNQYIIVGEIKSGEASTFIDAIGTGHIGYATVHAESASTTLDRLVMLLKRDIRAQQYQENFILHMLANSIDYIIYMKEYQIDEIIQLSVIDNKIQKEVTYQNKRRQHVT